MNNIDFNTVFKFPLGEGQNISSVCVHNGMDMW